MKHIFKRNKCIIPQAYRRPLMLVLVWELLVYNGSRLFTAGLQHYDLTSAIDAKVPFLPWTVSIYLSCYLFWLVNYILACHQEGDAPWIFLSADFLSKVICLICFILLPTTNVRPSVSGGSLWTLLMILVYRLDAADNLFPSIHCLTSWFSYIAVRDHPNVSTAYRRFSFVFALMVCVSTLTTKQHVIPDVFAGVLLAEFCWHMVIKTRFYLVYQYCFEGRLRSCKRGKTDSRR